MIHLEPESDRDRTALLTLLNEYPSMVLGHGCNSIDGSILHLQLSVTEGKSPDTDEAEECKVDDERLGLPGTNEQITHQRKTKMSASDQPIVTGRRGFWCEFNDKGQCLDLIDGPRDQSPGSEYVWIQEVRGDDPDIGTLVESIVHVIGSLAYARDKIIQGKQMNVAHCLSECEHGLRDAMRSSR